MRSRFSTPRSALQSTAQGLFRFELRLTLIAVFTLNLWVAIHPAPAVAQTCDRTAPVATAAAAESQVTALMSAGCLGGTSCDSSICKNINTLLKEKAPARASVASGLDAVLQEARTMAAAGGRDGEILLTRMGLTLAQFVESGRTAAAAWTIEDLVLFADESYEIDLRAALAACSDAGTCTKASSHVQRIVELATLFRRMLIKANEPSRNAFAAQLDLLDRQWRAYLGSSRGQYPWELAFNSARYRKTAQFDAPPTSQWILAHPGAAFELTKNADDRQPSESLLLELVGLYRWSWNEDKMRQRFGGSATLAWRDAGEDRKKLGYGFLAYLPRATSIGYIWRPQDGDDEHSLVMSADLVKFLRGTEGLKQRLIGGGATATAPKK